MRIIAKDKEGMTLYAKWYSTDGKSAMVYEEGRPLEIIDLDKEGFEIMVVNDDYEG